MTRHIFVALGLCLLCQRLEAICALPPPSCEALAKADVVFVAEVVERKIYDERSPSEAGHFPQGIHQYRFDVIEGLKGVQPGELWALFYWGLELDSFRPGSRYLIFANRRATGVLISGCSLTRELPPKGDDKVLTEIRACAKKFP
jgi:hypothetical protein